MQKTILSLNNIPLELTVEKRFLVYSFLSSLILNSLLFVVVLYLIGFFKLSFGYELLSSLFIIGFIIEMIINYNYTTYAKLTIDGSNVILEKGYFYKRKTIIPVSKLYLVSEDTNIFMSIIGIKSNCCHS